MDGLNYKMGWMIVAFDLPVGTKAQRKYATGFRKFLLEDGYQMLQFSVYARPTVTHARMATHLRRVKAAIPPEGAVRVIFVTQAQWERSYIVYGPPGSPLEEQDPEDLPDQLQIW